MATDLFSKANEEFVSENYKRAVELYSEAIDANDGKDDCYVNRAQAYLKLDQFKEACDDCEKALNINPKNGKAYLRKGISLFHLEDYKHAIDAFREGKQHDEASVDMFENWIDKCKSELPPMSQSSPQEADGSASVSPAAKCPPSTEPVTMPASVKTKYDWYQTATHVIVTVLIKNVQKEDFKADIKEHSLGVKIGQSSGEDYNLDIHLAHSILPEQSLYKIMTTKIEIKLKKQEGIQWTKLEGDGCSSSVKPFMAVPEEVLTQHYPTSSHVSTDWDKLAQEVAAEEKEEKKEGDAALNSLFQQIYSDGSDEVRRAMVKSFYESGGTVLSTNWNEVGEKEVDIKPPDGMEWKQY